MNTVQYRYLTYLLRGIGVLLLAWPFVPPALRAFGLDGVAFWLERPWMLTCHRLPERTMSFLGEKMPMCSRCAGLDLGLGLGLVLGWPYRGPMLLWAWLAMAQRCCSWPRSTRRVSDCTASGTPRAWRRVCSCPFPSAPP